MNLDIANFIGTFTPRLDEKGRLFLPAKFRPRLETGVVLTRGPEHCVFGWTPEAFEDFMGKVRQASFTNKAARDFGRMFFSGASQEVPDKQGRVSIPPVLRTWAALDRECTVVGAMDRIEIWDTEKWSQYEAELEGPFAEMTDEIMPGLF